MTPADRHRGRPRKGDEHTADGLQEAALLSFAEHGFDKTPLRVIAARAGVDVALISYRFGSKFGLWTAVVTTVAEDSMRQTEEFLHEAATLPASQRLNFISIKLVDLVFQRPAFAKVLLTELISNVEPERKELISDVLMRPIHTKIISFLKTNDILSDNPGEPDAGLTLIMGIAAVALVSSTAEFAVLFTKLGEDRQQLQEDLAKLFCRILEPH